MFTFVILNLIFSWGKTVMQWYKNSLGQSSFLIACDLHLKWKSWFLLIYCTLSKILFAMYVLPQENITLELWMGSLKMIH